MRELSDTLRAGKPLEKIPEFPAGAKMSGTRAAGKDILQPVVLDSGGIAIQIVVP